jgi:cytoskeletal protein RodZ
MTQRSDVMRRGSLIVLVAALAVWLTAGCGGSKNTGGPSSTSSAASSSAASSTTAAASSSATPSSGSQQPPAGAATFDVTIANGQVTPTNATWQAKVGQPVSVRVTSDAADELHVHSSPDHEFEVAAAPNQVFTFTVDVPGSVEIELHKLDKTIATLQVQP